MSKRAMTAYACIVRSVVGRCRRDRGYRLISCEQPTRGSVLMEGFAGKVAVVTGAGSGIGQALAIELARSGAKRGDQRRRHRGPGRHRGTAEGHRRAGEGRPARCHRARGVRVVRRRGQRALRQGQPDLQQRGHRVRRRHRGQPVQGHRKGDGRRLLGRRQRHQGVPAPPHRIRRRPRHQRLQRLRAVLGARAGRLQRGQVRGSRVHRGAAAGDGRRPAIRSR